MRQNRTKQAMLEAPPAEFIFSVTAVILTIVNFSFFEIDHGALHSAP